MATVLFSRHDRDGTEIASRNVEISCGGSPLWRVSEMFEAEVLAETGDGDSVLIRDATCRLFGYHGLMHSQTAFSFDHMFGF